MKLAFVLKVALIRGCVKSYLEFFDSCKSIQLIMTFLIHLSQIFTYTGYSCTRIRLLSLNYSGSVFLML